VDEFKFIGARRIFLKNGQIRGLGTKVPSGGVQGEPWLGSRGKPQKPMTGCENNA